MGRKLIHEFDPSQDPLWELVGPGKQFSDEWLASRIGYRVKSLWHIRTGRRHATRQFRAACSMAFRLPESNLFIDEDCVGRNQDAIPA